MSPRCLVACFACVVAVVAGETTEDSAAPYHHRDAVLDFPAAIGPLTKRGQREFQPVSTWGVGIRYEDGAGVNVDIYVYTKDLDTITDGIAGEAVQAEFERSAGEVAGMEKAGRYTELGALPDPAVPLAGRFLVRSFHYRQVDEDRREPGPVLHSHLLLRGHNGHFLKVRMTYPATAGEAALAVLAALVSHLTRPQ